MKRFARFAVLSVSLILLAFNGCTSNPALAAYREGLHQIDESIYDDYLAYVNEAEAGQLLPRTATDIKINRQTVEKARDFYKAGAEVAVPAGTSPAGPVPASQP